MMQLSPLVKSLRRHLLSYAWLSVVVATLLFLITIFLAYSLWVHASFLPEVFLRQEIGGLVLQGLMVILELAFAVTAFRGAKSVAQGQQIASWPYGLLLGLRCLNACVGAIAEQPLVVLVQLVIAAWMAYVIKKIKAYQLTLASSLSDEVGI